MEEPLEALRQQFVGRASAIQEIYRRNQELQVKEDEWRKQRQSAEAAGAELPALWNDEEYQAIRSERKIVMEALNQHLNKPKLQKEAISDLRGHLSVEQKAQLRQEMLQSLTSAPAEIQASVAQVMEDCVKKVLTEHEETPETEAMLAKIKKVREHLQQAT